MNIQNFDNESISSPKAKNRIVTVRDGCFIAGCEIGDGFMRRFGGAVSALIEGGAVLRVGPSAEIALIRTAIANTAIASAVISRGSMRPRAMIAVEISADDQEIERLLTMLNSAMMDGDKEACADFVALAGIRRAVAALKVS